MPCCFKIESLPKHLNQFINQFNSKRFLWEHYELIHAIIFQKQVKPKVGDLAKSIHGFEKYWMNWFMNWFKIKNMYNVK